MEVNGLGASVPAWSVSHQRPASTPAPAAKADAMSPRDEVEISSVGKRLDEASRMPGVREQRLAQIKAAIEAGTYDTPEKLELALNRMFDQVFADDGR